MDCVETSSYWFIEDVSEESHMVTVFLSNDLKLESQRLFKVAEAID